ncbi:MAG: hypothetical protein LBT40_18855, partial [Deltaproteobacteria bacterium]|nr:hypothetical protein [Deltaproteobacteria bacterium]
MQEKQEIWEIRQIFLKSGAGTSQSFVKSDVRLFTSQNLNYITIFDLNEVPPPIVHPLLNVRKGRFQADLAGSPARSPHFALPGRHHVKQGLATWSFATCGTAVGPTGHNAPFPARFRDNAPFPARLRNNAPF